MKRGALVGVALGAVVGTALAGRSMFQRVSVARMAGYLQRHLGQGVTAYLSGVKDAGTIGQWASGESRPVAPSDARLRFAYQAARRLVDAYDDETAQSWFVGMNPELDDEAPASVLRHGDGLEAWSSVVSAAREFVESGRC